MNELIVNCLFFKNKKILFKMEVKEVPLEKLTKDQLQYVGKQIDAEIQSYSSYYTSLKVAHNKFLDNKDYIHDLKTYENKDILVPITSSLYLPGKCSDVKKLTIEIGGNFFVETSIDRAEQFCDRKIDTIKKSMDKIDQIIKNKSDQLNAINQNIIEKSEKKA